MPSIKIVRVPSGEAPIDVRAAWVGVEVPLKPNQFKSGFIIGSEGGVPDSSNADGWDVSLKDAVDALEKKGERLAVLYWSRNVISAASGTLRFGKQFCEYIP